MRTKSFSENELSVAGLSRAVRGPGGGCSTLARAAIVSGLVAVALAARPLAADALFPSVASAAGAYDTVWTTDLELTNAGTVQASTTLVFYDWSRGAGGRSHSATVSVPPKSRSRYEDILQSVFKLSPPAFGPLRVSGGLVGAAVEVRTANACGKVGFALQGLDPADLRATGLLTGLRSGGGGRTNVAVWNPSSAAATVSFRVVGGTAPYTMNLAAGEWRQLNDFSSFFPSAEWLPAVTFAADQPLAIMASVVDNASGQAFAVIPAKVPSGTGSSEPRVELTSVPPRGSSNDLRGRVYNVAPQDFKVLVYIYITGWWTKPYFNSPSVPIQADSTFACDITTGGYDTSASAIAAFVVPIDFPPPLMGGGGTLPGVLDSASVAKITVSR